MNKRLMKILSSAVGGRGGQTSSSCLDEMSLLPSELEKTFLMKVVGNGLFLPPTKVHIIVPSRTPDMGKILSSVWAGLQDRFRLLFCGQTLNLKTEDLGLTLFMNIVGLFLSFPSI